VVIRLGQRDIESVRLMGDTAVVVSRVKFVGKDKKNGQTFNGANRTTVVLAKRNGKWQAVASQSTREITPSDEKTLDKFLTDFTNALQKNSADAVAPFYDDQWIMVNLNGTTTSREQQLADLRSGDLKHGSISVDEKSMRMFGRETAIAVAKVTLSGSSYKGRDLSGSYRVTSVLRKADTDRWVIVSQHIT
jgi:ketosteroid isomerase-like protein